MINIEQWMQEYKKKILSHFGDRVLFIGLQGSFARNEAHENSDIDTVLLLDQLDPKDLKEYRTILETLPERKRVCGFVAGKKEIVSWSPSDLFQFWNDTKSYYGNSTDFLPSNSRLDVQQAILTGVCNLYHVCGHNYLHERDPRILKDLCKSVVFILQAVCCFETGHYCQLRSDLKQKLSESDRVLLEYTENTKKELDLLISSGNSTEHLLEECSARLLQWSGKLIEKYRINS